MISAPRGAPVLPPNWTEVLETMQQALAQAVTAAAAREKALMPEPFAVTPALDASDQRARAFTARLRQVEQAAAEAEAKIIADEKTLADWQNAAAVVRQRLAKWLDPAV